MSSSRSPSISKVVAPIRILVADRDHLSSQLLSESLGRDGTLDVVAVVSTSDALLLAAHKPDVAVISLDFDAVPRKGLQVARTLHAHHPHIHIVILLEVCTRESVIAAFRCGATGVFCRTQDLSRLRTCLERVNQGEIWASGNEAQYLLEALRSAPSCDDLDDGRLSLLSKRELEVAQHAAQGQGNKQIASDLNLSEHTVKNYLVRVFEKLGISSRFELLFLLFNERNYPLSNRAAEFDIAGLSHSIETYLRAAENGFIAAQYLVGLAHLEGCGVEKNGRSAYYWLRIAEENSHQLRQHTRALTEDLKPNMKSDELETLEHHIAAAVHRDQMLTKNRSSDFIKRSSASPPLRMAM